MQRSSCEKASSQHHRHPNPQHHQQSSLGRQPESVRFTPGTTCFGTSQRLPRHGRSGVPGPGSYKVRRGGGDGHVLLSVYQSSIRMWVAALYLNRPLIIRSHQHARNPRRRRRRSQLLLGLGEQTESRRCTSAKATFGTCTCGATGRPRWGGGVAAMGARRAAGLQAAGCLLVDDGGLHAALCSLLCKATSQPNRPTDQIDQTDNQPGLPGRGADEDLLREGVAAARQLQRAGVGRAAGEWLCRNPTAWRWVAVTRDQQMKPKPLHPPGSITPISIHNP
jgi:hypothetical protein